MVETAGFHLIESFSREPQKLSTVRAEFDALVAPYYFDNLVHQDYLLTRAHALSRLPSKARAVRVTIWAAFADSYAGGLRLSHSVARS